MAVENQKPRESSGTPSIDDIITLTFSSIDQMAGKLDEIPAKAETKTHTLLELLDTPDVFKNKAAFYNAMNDLSEEVGHAYHTVLAIELARQRVSPPEPKDLLELLSKQAQPNQPVVLQPTAPQLGVLSGYWYAKAAKEISKATLQSKQDQNVPQISTSKEVIDILEFGRQLTPEFNRVYTWFQQSLDHLGCGFDDADTQERFLSELRKHMNKLAGIIRSFCRTITEYRKELYGARKERIATSIIALKMAEAHAQEEAEQTPSLDRMSEEIMKRARG